MKKVILSAILFSITLQAPALVFAQSLGGTYNPNSNLNSDGNLVGSTIGSFGSAGLTCMLADEKVKQFLSSTLSNANGLVGRGIRSITTKNVNTLSTTDYEVIDVEGEDLLVPTMVVTKQLNGLGKLLGLKGTSIIGGADTQQVADKNLQDQTEALRNQAKKDITKELCWDQFANKARNLALKQVTMSTLRWVNTGFDGNPMYVRDINTYLNSVKKDQVNRLLPELETDNSLFGKSLRRIITKQVTNRDINIPIPQVSTSTTEGRAFNAWIQDFTNGGWDAFLNSENHPIGALFGATGKLNSRLSTQEQNIREELQRNSGFLDIKVCTDNEGIPNQNVLVTNNKCKNFATVTPGSVVASQVTGILGSPMRQTELVDEINEVVDGFFKKIGDSITSKTGLFGLTGGGTIATTGGFGFNAVYNTVGNVVGSSNLLDLASFSSAGIENIDVSRPQKIRAIIKAQGDYLSVSRDAYITAGAILPKLGQLDYCIPGPNPTWEEALTENIGIVFDNILFTSSGNTEQPEIVITNPSLIDKITNNYTPIKVSRFMELENIGSKKEGAKTGAQFGMSVGSMFKSPEPLTSTIVAVGSAVIGGLVGFLTNKYEKVYGIGLFIHRYDGSDDILAKEVFTKSATQMMNEIRTTYSKDNVLAAFGTKIQNSVRYFQGQDMYELTKSLVPYAQNFSEMTGQYEMMNNQVTGNIAELESIYKESQSIVEIAKARYIAQRQAAGTPVDLSCINGATYGYVIDKTPVKFREKKESESENRELTNLANYHNYFYSNL